MPFLDHLEELRWRILYSLLAVVLATVAGWFIVDRLDVIGLLMRPIVPLLPDHKLKFTSPTEPFLITLKFAFVVGLVLASPVVIYQAWAFLAPALYERERRLIVPALSVGVLLFLGGAVIAYAWVLPRALRVLFSFQQSVLAPIITADGYFGFAAQIMIAFGLVSELPLVVVILAALGLVTPQFLAKNRRYALALSAVAAALLTPPDAVSMLLMMLPLALLYEVSIWCAWVVTKRRARREAAGRTGATHAAGIVGLLLLAAAAGAGGLAAQGRAPLFAVDTAARRRAAADSAAAAGRLDTATARRLGLPTGPSRSFPAADPVIDSLLKLKGYRITRYVADTLVAVGGDTETIYLRGEAYVEREGTKLQSDSIKYRQASCRLDAAGDPQLFEGSTVLVGEGMRYDTCVKRGTIERALTAVQQGGATWYVRGNLAVDSGSTRVYGAHSEITSDDHPVPDYHFATGEVKWLNKNVMVARPAALYIRDVPIMWLPFMFQDIRKGRRSGILVPRFGLNDIVRPTRGYQRHVANLGYYFVVNDYVDLLAAGDWYAGRYMSLRAQTRYRWLDQFIQGAVSIDRLNQLDAPLASTRFGWQHQQTFSSRTTFRATVDYATSASVIQTNTVNPYLATARLSSDATFNKRFDWGTLDLGGGRSQDLSNGQITQNFPRVTLTPSPVNISPSITWSPGFSFNNQQALHVAQAPLLVAGARPVPDTLAQFADNRETDVSLQTPFRLGRWNWGNSFAIVDRANNARQEYDIPDSTAPGGVRRLLYARTYSTAIDWQTGINLPSFFTGSWKLQPGIAIINQTSAGPFMIRNEQTGGRFLRQGKRLQFNASVTPTFFGFFPGVGPIARIRHAISPLVSYAYAPGSSVDPAFARALDPTGRNFLTRSDPQQTINLGLSQNIEAKLKAPSGDTLEHAPKKVRLLGINTSALSYNFEQAKQPHHTGWQTQTMNNTFASDLLPGFSLSLTHDLWRGQVGVDTAKFSPFLTNVAASFTVTPATLRGIGRLFGLGRGAAPPGAPPAGGPTTIVDSSGQAPLFGQKAFLGPGALPFGVLGRAGAGGGFHLSVAYSRTRIRPTADTLNTATAFVAGRGGTDQLSLNLAFSPTAHWALTWNSLYDFDTQQFGQHDIRLERDLHRWHASFSFLKSPNGNFAFTFFITLLDQPDIKFNYEQASFVQQ